jgi:hypothetical protein
LLAVAIVIVIVAVGVLLGFISLSSGSQYEKKSKVYWQSTDIALSDWMVSDIGYSNFVVQNNKDYQIYLRSMSLDTGSLSRSFPINVNLLPGNTYNFNAPLVGCRSGGSYSYVVGFSFDSIESDISNKRFTGVEPLVGVCQRKDIELRSGQSSCWDTAGASRSCSGTGEDAAVSGKAKAFVNNGDGSVSDPYTGLMWMQNDSVSTLTWQNALTYCNNGVLCSDGSFQSSGSCSGHGTVKYSDWHLPTVAEIYTMADYGYPGGGYKNGAFTWGGSTYWSGTSMPASPARAYYADLSSGYVLYNVKSGSRLARCVRLVESSIAQLRSGQTLCWDAAGTSRSCSGTGEDADVSGAAKAFVNNGDGSVSDPQTGLMWQRSDYGSTLTWQNALTYCNSGVLCTDGTFQGSGSCSGHGSVKYDDWHLPTEAEVNTLIDYSMPGGSYDFRNSAFTWSGSPYWSSTSLAGSPGSAYLANMGLGSVSDGVKGLGLSYMARCVRPEN